MNKLLFQVEDERSIIIQKAIALADAIRKSKSLVIYTGAGISTVRTSTVLVFQKCKYWKQLSLF